MTNTPLTTPRPQHQRLNAFVGTWRLEGENREGAPVGPGAKVTGEDTFEWLPGDFFLIWRWDQHFNDDRFTGISIIGYDPSHDTYFAHNFDNGGFERVYDVTEQDGQWTFTGEHERATIEFGQNGTVMTKQWEIAEDGSHWQPLCDVTGTKMG